MNATQTIFWKVPKRLNVKKLEIGHQSPCVEVGLPVVWQRESWVPWVFNWMCFSDQAF